MTAIVVVKVHIASGSTPLDQDFTPIPETD
jgi:hypothetical protein